MKQIRQTHADVEIYLKKFDMRMDQHIETYCMMKEDQWYDQNEVERHGLQGLDDEISYNKYIDYIKMHEDAERWINRL